MTWIGTCNFGGVPNIKLTSGEISKLFSDGLTHLYVDIPYEMVSEVVADVHLLDLAVLVLGLHEDVLEEVVVMLLDKWEQELIE